MIVLPFPPPPPAVQRALELLDAGRRGQRGHLARAADHAAPDCPWEPAGCRDELRDAVWSWCDHVVAWLNHEYAWRPTHMIPACWRRHPHIARELPVLAVRRWQAQTAADTEPLEEWHRYAFPMFCDRMEDRLGESSCRTGRHQDWPAESRYAAFHPATAPDRPSPTPAAAHSAGAGGSSPGRT